MRNAVIPMLRRETTISADPSYLPARRVDEGCVRRRYLSLGALLLLLLLLLNGWAADGRAGTLYWDSNGAVPGCGTGNGDWVTSNWSTDPLGAAATSPWTDGSDAVFSAGSDATGDVNITASTGDVLVGNLSVEEGSVSIAGSGSLRFSGNQTWTVNAGTGLSVANNVTNVNGTTLTINSLGNTTLSGALTGNSGLTKTGAGGLTLSGDINLMTSKGYLTVSGGTAVANGTIQPYGAIVSGSSGGSGRLLLSGGTMDVYSGLFVGGTSGAPGTFEMTGGTLTAANYLSVGSDSCTPSISQSGGIATCDSLRVGVRYTYSNVATYRLSGNGELRSRESLVGGDWGTGSFYQTGGSHVVSANLTLGYMASCYGYYQLDGGTLTTGSTFLGSYYGDGDFQQNGGSFSAGYLNVKPGHSYTMRGGQLSALDSAFIGGTFDLGSSRGSVTMGGIANFSRATILGGQQTMFSVGSDSLVIFPAGFNPAAQLASFVNNGLVAYADDAVTIPAGRTVKGSGTIANPIYCAGSLLQQAAWTVPTSASVSNNSINLTTGIMVDGGTVHLGRAANLYVRDSSSGISGGELQTSSLQVGNNTPGTFTQTGGTVTASTMTVGSSTGNSRITGTYAISSGSLSVVNNLVLGSTQGQGILQQAGGQVSVGTLTLGTGGHGGPPLALYQISGGTLSAGTLTAGGMYATGTLEVFGSDPVISTGSFQLASPLGTACGRLFSHVEDDGISTISVTGNASLPGTWQVFDDGAPAGRWNVLQASGTVSTPGTVLLPDATWSWGIDSSNTLWVQHVPEPSTGVLLASGVLGVLIGVWGMRRNSRPSLRRLAGTLAPWLANG